MSGERVYQNLGQLTVGDKLNENGCLSGPPVYHRLPTAYGIRFGCFGSLQGNAL